MVSLKEFVAGFDPDFLDDDQAATWALEVAEAVKDKQDADYTKWPQNVLNLRVKNLVKKHPELTKAEEKSDAEKEKERIEEEKKKKAAADAKAAAEKAKEIAAEKAKKKKDLEDKMKDTGVVKSEYLALLDMKTNDLDGLKKRLSVITTKSNLTFLHAKKAQAIDWTKLDFSKEAANDLLLLAYYCVLNGPVGVNTKTTWPFLTGTKSIKDVMVEAGVVGEMSNGPWRAFCKIVQDNTDQKLEGVKNSKCMTVYGQLWPDCNASFIAKARAKEMAEQKSINDNAAKIFGNL